MKAFIIRFYKQVLPKSLRYRIALVRYHIKKKSNNTIRIFLSLLKPTWILLTKFFWMGPEDLNQVSIIKERNKIKEIEIKKKGGEIANYENLIKYKKSDTLFILGSGASINEISSKQWEEIKKHDSLAFNLFVLHNFVPTYYHLEFTREIHPYYFQIIQSKWDKIKEVPLMVNYKHVESNKPLSDYRWLNNTLFTNPYFLYNNNLIKKYLKYFYSVEKLKENNFNIHYRGSLSLMISLGILLGYKKIVLMGIDLNNNEYFFHDKHLYNSFLHKKVIDFHLSLIEKNYGNRKVHATADRDLFKNDLTIEEFIDIFNSVIKRASKTKIFIGSNKSLLSKFLEHYRFQS
jgi:hypothetical protein